MRPLTLTSTIILPVPGGGTRELTVAERILESIRATGYDATVAAARARVTKTQLTAWLRRGELALQRYAEGQNLSSNETALAEFALDVDEAHAEWETRANSQLERLAQGGIPLLTVTEKVEAIRNPETGEETGLVHVERSTRSTTTLPDAATIRWMLETKRRARYGRSVAVTGADGGPIQVEDTAETAARLAQEIRAYRQGLADQAARDAEERAAANGHVET